MEGIKSLTTLHVFLLYFALYLSYLPYITQVLLGSQAVVSLLILTHRWSALSTTTVTTNSYVDSVGKK
jgi:hypothetical protein